MFLGTYRTKLDDKSRLTLPRDWAHDFAMGIVITRGVDQSLIAFPQSKFENMAKGLDDLGLTSTDVRRWARFLGALAIDIVPDKKGRVALPLAQLKFAGIANDVTLVGLLGYIQIWNPQKHEELEAKDVVDIIQIADRVDKLMRAPIG